MINWTKNRVVNFTERFAAGYVPVLVGLDGHLYDQPQFLKCLADSGVINDVPQNGTAAEIADRRQKRWDSYLGKIREYGLGFSVMERRPGGQTRNIWRASDIAKSFAAGQLDYRQFMAVQVMRTQLPRPSMPLNPAAPAYAELLRGAQIRPFQLVLEALDELEARDEDAFLTRDEIFAHLTQAERHDQLGPIVDDIVAARSGSSAGAPAQPVGDESADIWLNEFAATGYVRKLQGRAGLPERLVRHLPRLEEARLLSARIPLVPYDTTTESIERYLEFLGTMPLPAEIEVLSMEPLVVQLQVPEDAVFDAAESTLTGQATVLGGLNTGALIALAGDVLDETTKATIYEVVEAATNYDVAPVAIRIVPKFTDIDLKPIAFA